MAENVSKESNLLEKLVSLSKRRGFVYPGSDLYGGLANTYDYGPMGTELLRNIRNLWWEQFVHQRDDIVGLDASTISHHRIWEASGHIAGFADALVDCKHCQTRIRADHLIEDDLEAHKEDLKDFLKNGPKLPPELTQDAVEKYISTQKVEGLSVEQMNAIINLHKIPCPNCGEFDWTPVRKFNQLFAVQLGIVEGEQGLAYLRGETAQGMFVNFENILSSTRVRLPFGIAQLGKSFRNEITLGNFVFRTIEFEQGEIEYFFDPDTSKWEELFEDWKKVMHSFVVERLGIKEKNLRWRTHGDEERSFYSKRTEDLEYKFPFGFKELWGLAYRTDYDLKQHIKFSGKELSIMDPTTNKKIIPHVIEPAVGINRLFLMILADAYTEEDGRVLLKLNPQLAPVKVAVFPLLANKPDLISKAKEVHSLLKKDLVTAWDDRGNIGKRYAYQDEVGTPFCVTIDFQTLEDGTVTVRDRDTAKQERISVSMLLEFFSTKLS